MTTRAGLEAMLAAGQDNAMLRFALGSLLMKDRGFAEAAVHFQRATELDPEYPAAWKNWGRCLAAAGRNAEARAVLLRAVEIAARRGAKQVEREAGVFLKRLGSLEEQ